MDPVSLLAGLILAQVPAQMTMECIAEANGRKFLADKGYSLQSNAASDAGQVIAVYEKGDQRVVVTFFDGLACQAGYGLNWHDRPIQPLKGDPV
ncbi:MAG: hypothetical protein AAF141_05850 [Pseudomonadota bacterium]